MTDAKDELETESATAAAELGRAAKVLADLSEKHAEAAAHAASASNMLAESIEDDLELDGDVDMDLPDPTVNFEALDLLMFAQHISEFGSQNKQIIAQFDDVNEHLTDFCASYNRVVADPRFSEALGLSAAEREKALCHLSDAMIEGGAAEEDDGQRDAI